jgi:D-serine deaminase-like pyridoxal phosphate-dependent protein
LYAAKDALETPVLVVDLDVMESNIDEYVSLAKANDVRLRSHVKTHKNAEIAKVQHERSEGGGIACQTLGEVEVMAKNGLDDVYLSYNVVGERKLDHHVWLSEKLDRFATTVDGPGNIDPLQSVAAEHGVTVGVILEVNVGLDRTGVLAEESMVRTANRIVDQPNLDLRGLLAYEAQVKSEAETKAEYEEYCWEAMEKAQAAVERLEADGIPIEEVKVGGTATSPYSCQHPVVTEINPGQYTFNDVGEIQARPWAVDKSDCALTVLGTVISTQVDDQVVVDSGSKSLSMDTDRMPLAKHRDDVAYAGYSEEHGHIDTSESSDQFAVGDRMEFIAPHVCPTVNLHDTVLGVRDGVVEEVWNVQARGKVR